MVSRVKAANSDVLCQSLLASSDMDLVRNCTLRELSVNFFPFSRLYTCHVKLKQFINYIVHCHENYLHVCLLFMQVQCR